MNLIKHFFLIPIFGIFCSAAFSQALPIGIDEDFSDWNETASSLSDPEGDGSDIDFLSFSVSNDDNYLYIKLKMTDETLLNDDNKIFLQIDTDNNSETGYSVNGIGAELGWNFAGRFGYYNAPSGSKVTVEHSDISFMALPTVSSAEFEMAVSRHAEINGNKLFPGNTVKIAFYDNRTQGDYMPDPGQTFTYSFDDETAVSEPEPISLERKNNENIRIMTFNVLFDGLIDSDRQDAFGRIMKAVAPDIVTFNEAWDTQAYQAENLMNQWVMLSQGSWQCIEADNGNITCSVYPISDTYRILPGHRITAALIDLPENYDSDLLSINGHLKCCGGSSNNAERQEEADAFAAFVRNVINGESSLNVPTNTPIVLSGDMNLVGNRQQLTTLLTGDIQNTSSFGQGQALDWDGTALKDLVSSHTNGRHAYTWYDETSSYWPGRLDYIIYSDAVMQHTHAYTLDTRLMTSEELSQYGLQKQDSEASDHLAKVADFTLSDAALSSEKSDFIIMSDSMQGSYIITSQSNQEIHRLTVYAGTGQIVLDKNIHNTFYRLNLQNRASGIYIIKIQSDKRKSQTIKVVH